MKRSTKLLCALITVCLLAGAVMTSAFAFDKSYVDSLVAEQLKVDGASNFTVSGIGVGSYSDGNSTSNNNYVDAKGNTVVKMYNTGTTANQSANTFLEFDASDTKSTKVSDNYALINAGVMKNAYHVYDFDIGTDKYSVKIGYELRTVYTSTTSSDKTVTTVTYTYDIQEAYKTYTPEEFTEERVAADVAAKTQELIDLKALSEHGTEYLTKVVTTKTSGTSVKEEEYTSLYNFDLGFDNMAQYDWTVEDAMASKDLALSVGDHVYIMGRTWASATASVKSFSAYLRWRKDSSGKWYFTDVNSASGKNLGYMTNTVGEYDHITVIVETTAPAEGSTKGGAQAHFFINGNYAYSADKSTGFYSIGIECLRLVVLGAAKTQDRYSYNVANSASNFYAADYNSANFYGLDDYFTSGDYKTKSLTELTDVVYTEDYISPNGYVFVKDGFVSSTPVSSDTRIAETIATVKDGSKLYTTIDIPSLTVPEGVSSFDIITGAGATVALSDASINSGYVLESTEDGYKVYLDFSDRTVYVEWQDIKGNLITTTSVLHGAAPDSTGIIANSYDKNTNSIYSATVSGWTWNLDGDVRVITPDMLAAGGKVVMTPAVSGSVTETKNVSFYMGKRYDDTLVVAPVPSVNNNYTSYVGASADSVINNAKQLKNGADTCVLTSDFVGTKASGATTKAQSLPTDSTLNFDLNGHVFAREGAGNTFGNAFFTVTEGGTFNCYSSEPGGIIAMAVLRASNVNVTTSSGGIANIATKVDQATINIGDMLDSKGNVLKACGDNFTYIGGTCVLVNGNIDADGTNGTTAYDANALLRNNKKITVNLNGGAYYAPYRASYALVLTQAPDTVVNIDGITFVSAYYTSSSLFHDYENQSYTDVDDRDGDGNTTEKAYYYYATNSTVTVKNSKLYAMGAAEDSNGNLYGKTTYSIINRVDEESTVYFENCDMIGSIVSKLSGNITFGVGNNIADLGGFNIETHERLHFAEGVSFAKPQGLYLTANVPHPETTAAWESCFDITLKSGATIDGVLDTQAEAGNVQSAYLKSIIYDLEKFTSIKFEALYTYVTYDVNNVPDIMAEVRWNDYEGNLITTTYELIGMEPSIPEAVTAVVGGLIRKQWYEKSFSWTEAETGFVVVDGVNVFTPSPVLTAKIRGMKVNVSLFEDASFNLYLPVDELITNISVDGAALSSEKVTIGGVQYYKVSAKFGVDEFEAKKASISFTAEGKTLTYPVTLDLVSYASVVSDSYTCGSEEAALVYELLAYKNDIACAVAQGYTATKAFDDFMAKHVDCGCAAAEPEIRDAEAAVNYDAIISKGVTGIAYKLDIDEIGMAIYVNDGVAVDSVSYTDDFGRAMTHTAAKENLILKDGYYLVTGVSAAYIDNIMTITVDGAEGTYSLGKYILNQPAVEIAKSLYKYSTAAENYKYVRESENDKAIYSGMKSVLLLGQSNMTSSNDHTVVEPVRDDRLFMMRNDVWIPMEEPIFTGSSLYGAGIGATFGMGFVDAFDVELGLVPCARGGTTLENWAVGGELYTETVRKAKIAQETSEIVGILWHQGEGNQNDTQYAEKLQVIFDSLIEELGLDPEEIVIITGELNGTRSDEVHMPELIDLGKHYPNYAIALSDGLTTRDPNTHFDAPSMRVFGYRYFDLFYNIKTGKHYYYNEDKNSYLRID